MEPIFSNFDDNQTNMGLEKTRFETVDKNWKHMMK